MLDRRPFADENRAADERLTDGPAMNRRFEAKLKIARDLLESVPDIGGILEKHPMLGVLEIEKIGRRKYFGMAVRRSL